MKVCQAFTLVEVLLVLGLLAIVLLMAVPHYTSITRRVQRLHAAQQLLQLSADLSQYYAFHHRYQGFVMPPGLHNQYYRFVLEAVTKHGFHLKAMPLFNDESCGDLIINEKLQKSITGNLSVTKCW